MTIVPLMHTRRWAVGGPIWQVELTRRDFVNVFTGPPCNMEGVHAFMKTRLKKVTYPPAPYFLPALCSQHNAG